MSIQPELKTVLKRLRLSPMLATLPDRLAYARKEKLDYAQFLELVLSDEVERRDQKHVSNRLSAAGFEEECTLERFDWSAKIRIDKARLTDLFGLHFIERKENVVFCGPVGVGKSFLAQALGHAACRANYRVLFTKADQLLKTLARSRADNSFDRELRSFISPDLLIDRRSGHVPRHRGRHSLASPSPSASRDSSAASCSLSNPGIPWRLSQFLLC
jgi:DNA replication protein DnaC